MLSSVLIRRISPKSLTTIITQSLSTTPPNVKTSQSQRPNLDTNTICNTLSCYSNDWKSALDFFNWVETNCEFKHNTETYNYMIDILGKHFEFDQCKNLINRMKGSGFASPDHATFRVLFKRYVSARSVQDAIEIYGRLDEFNLKDWTSFCNLVDALCEYKHVVEAHDLCFSEKVGFGLELDDSILKKRKCTKICNMILRGWSKIGWWSKCRDFWEEMNRIGVRKDLHSYSIYMDIMCKSRKPWKAVKLYKEMKSKGIKLDVVAYNTVIHAIGLSEGVDFAKSVYREMRELGCMPNVVTCNTVMKLLCENGRVSEAYKMLDEMHNRGVAPNAITYHCFFGYLEKPREILQLFDRMIEKGVKPTLDTYVMLMRKFGRWGFLRPVLIVWNKMEELGCSPNESAYNALIDAFIQKGMLDMARKFQEEMIAKGLSAKPREELGINHLEDGNGSIVDWWPGSDGAILRK